MGYTEASPNSAAETSCEILSQREKRPHYIHCRGTNIRTAFDFSWKTM